MTKWNFTQRTRVIIQAILLLTTFFSIINISNAQSISNSPVQLQYALPQSYPAPEFQGINNWLNSPPLTLQSLKGKVVLLDFWSYTCVYCYKAMPHLNDWYNKYSSQGLVIIGIHNFDNPIDNNVAKVEQVVQAYGMQYPIAMDNDSVMWRQYNPQYWPSTFLIDKNGNIVYSHIGQGAYNIIENNIRVLLNQNASE